MTDVPLESLRPMTGPRLRPRVCIYQGASCANLCRGTLRTPSWIRRMSLQEIGRRRSMSRFVGLVARYSSRQYEAVDGMLSQDGRLGKKADQWEAKRGSQL